MIACFGQLCASASLHTCVYRQHWFAACRQKAFNLVFIAWTAQFSMFYTNADITGYPEPSIAGVPS